MSDPNLPATPQDVSMPDGLEDFGASDMLMPRINIDHAEGTFKDNLSGEQYSEIDCVILGIVRQRILWPATVGDGEAKQMPLCRAPAFTVGIPDTEHFPYDKTHFQAGQEELSCESCPLKEWDSHPTRESSWCAEQHTYVIMLGGAPAILTLARSAIMPSRAYMTSFARDRQAMYTVQTHIELDHRKRGSNKYAVPTFSRGPATDRNDWQMFSENLRNIRDFLQSRRITANEEETDTDTSADAPTAADNTHPKAAATVGANGADDEVPF